jgi:hypothetical protein
MKTAFFYSFFGVKSHRNYKAKLNLLPAKPTCQNLSITFGYDTAGKASGADYLLPE